MSAIRKRSRGWTQAEEIEKQFETHGNALFYLATQPSQYATVAAGLGRAGLARANGWRRLVVEKRFGRDLESARELNRQLHAVFDESAIYRIDHYLGKETVQNIFAFRFGNLIFEPLLEPALHKATCRSLRQSRSAWRAVALITRKPARYVT